MTLDPDNPVVKLCVAGMEAEGAGQLDQAHDLFQRAWEARQDDLDACIAAHFLARHRPPEEMLFWNRMAIDHADAAAALQGEIIRGFYPSLYLNIGWSHEQVGDAAAARRCYELAAARLEILPATPYGDVVRKGVAAGWARVGDL
jgi:tetratricopeptide (TPR) repeat protein